LTATVVDEGKDVNWHRYFLALGTTAVLTLVADVLLNAVVFRDVYTRSSSFLLPVDELNSRIWLGWAALIAITGAFGFLLVRGGWLGVRGGLQSGLVLAVAGIAGVAGIASIVAWPDELLVAVAVQQFVNGLLLGIVFALVYRPPHAR
jgi:hypothetical protein